MGTILFSRKSVLHQRRKEFENLLKQKKATSLIFDELLKYETGIWGDWIAQKSGALKPYFACVMKNNYSDNSSFALYLYDSMFEKSPKVMFLLKDLIFVDYGIEMSPPEERKNDKVFSWLKMTSYDSLNRDF